MEMDNVMDAMENVDGISEATEAVGTAAEAAVEAATGDNPVAKVVIKGLKIVVGTALAGGIIYAAKKTFCKPTKYSELDMAGMVEVADTKKK